MSELAYLVAALVPSTEWWAMNGGGPSEPPLANASASRPAENRERPSRFVSGL